MTAAEAVAAAAAEGLTLVLADNATGFKDVFRNPLARRPFKAYPTVKGRSEHLGYFATAEEAALVIARFFGPQ